MGVLIDSGIVFFFAFAWVLSYLTSDKKTMDIIRSGSKNMHTDENFNLTASTGKNTDMFRKITSSTSYIDYVDKGMKYSQTFYMDSISLVLLLIKVLFTLKVSRQINWIFLTLERVSY